MRERLSLQLQHRWTERICRHTARCYVSVAVLDGKIYALGGYDGDRRTNTAERCDPATNTWSLIADMNDQRSDACATVVDSKATRNASSERKQRRLDQWIALLGKRLHPF
ncbi:hypothetical protein HPB51_004507 [Rhipicephalus microplus]|uniref:Uncharacterized protein n=1 Tax=Rhipicephalus microplus TaxID=6941 RepID=A0A9J6ELM7_RHIMP|nr:hypothetical protein HPB51_004507 [Rhipicephalus microplus]